MQTPSSNGEDQIRRIMQEHEFEFDANSWTRLDAQLSRPKRRRRLLPLVLLLLIVLLLGGLYRFGLRSPGNMPRYTSGTADHTPAGSSAPATRPTQAWPGRTTSAGADGVTAAPTVGGKPETQSGTSAGTKPRGKETGRPPAPRRASVETILPPIGPAPPAAGSSPAPDAGAPESRAEEIPGLLLPAWATPDILPGLALVPPPAEAEAPAAPAARPVVRPSLERAHLSWLVGAQAAPAGTHLDGGMHLGLSVDYPLRGPWALRADLMLKKIDGYGLNVSFNDTLYSPFGGIQPFSVRLSDNALWYVELPVSLRRALGDRQALLFSLRPALVLGGGNADETNGPVPDAWQRPRLENGLRRLDFGLGIGWEHRLAPRWWVGLRYQQGLLDLTHDNFFRDTRTHLNADLQLSLRYIFTTF